MKKEVSEEERKKQQGYKDDYRRRTKNIRITYSKSTPEKKLEEIKYDVEVLKKNTLPILHTETLLLIRIKLHCA